MSDSDLYSRLLMPKGHGYPLFHPQPSDDLPELNRRIGTEIGDVGIVTQNGGFDPIFNICHAASHATNCRFGVPQCFEPIHLGPNDIIKLTQYHLPGSDISNTIVNKKRVGAQAATENNVFLPLGAGAEVEVSVNSKDAGLLLLPHGASRRDLRPVQTFRDYALEHAESWYEFVNGDLHRMIGSGDLYLVTGVTKSTSWSLAALEDHSENGRMELKLKATQVSSASVSCTWEWENNSSSFKAGPRRHSGEESWQDNQSVFIRGFKVALRRWPLRRSPKPQVVSIGSKWSNMQSKGTFIPFSQPQLPKNGLARSPPNTPDSGGASDEDAVDDFPNQYHPSVAINEYLFDCAPDAMVAVTHDDEWASVLIEADDKIPEPDELIRRITTKFNIDTASGGVCLQALSASGEEQSEDAFQDSPEAGCILPPDYTFDDSPGICRTAEDITISEYVDALEENSQHVQAMDLKQTPPSSALPTPTRISMSNLDWRGVGKDIAERLAALLCPAVTSEEYLTSNAQLTIDPKLLKHARDTLCAELPPRPIAEALAKAYRERANLKAQQDVNVVIDYCKFLALYPNREDEQYKEVQKKVSTLAVCLNNDKRREEELPLSLREQSNGTIPIPKPSWSSSKVLMGASSLIGVGSSVIAICLLVSSYRRLG